MFKEGDRVRLIEADYTGGIEPLGEEFIGETGVIRTVMTAGWYGVNLDDWNFILLTKDADMEIIEEKEED